MKWALHRHCSQLIGTGRWVLVRGVCARKSARRWAQAPWQHRLRGLLNELSSASVLRNASRKKNKMRIFSAPIGKEVNNEQFAVGHFPRFLKLDQLRGRTRLLAGGWCARIGIITFRTARMLGLRIVFLRGVFPVLGLVLKLSLLLVDAFHDLDSNQPLVKLKKREVKLPHRKALSNSPFPPTFL
ncbi:LAQU0S16e01728g1_1 [Lachancea quebecensis]|uniref:LAQU0S16e01728g1_1 n=1 Tax=Lachancea quebecensis TaxID=1654605 RepID=A0A0P1KW00_9SACH|nr:LAQU0S16e01728g1_1 [Lachancea quebecensis]